VADKVSILGARRAISQRQEAKASQQRATWERLSIMVKIPV
jgi:hypothetical protein